MYICTYIYIDMHIIIRQEGSSESEEINGNCGRQEKGDKSEYGQNTWYTCMKISSLNPSFCIINT